MGSLGDQITFAFIKSVNCPIHGEFCHTVGKTEFCKARIEKAKVQWHNHLLKKKGRL